MEIETSSMAVLAISGAMSFGLGRIFVHFRGKKRKEAIRQAQERAAQALRDRPPEVESRNKSKRQRQLQQLAKKPDHSPR